MRLRIGELRDGDLVEVASARAPVRLGREVFDHGRIGATTMREALRALRAFRVVLERAGVRSYRAVATSATREAENGDELARRAARDAGVDLEIIDGDEEARLVRLAVAKHVSLAGKTVLADVGGGSTEVTVLDDRRVVRASSLALGTVRLTGDGERIGRRRMRALEDAVDESVSAVARHLRDADRVVATGGTVRVLARLAGGERGRVRAEELEALADRARRLDHDERMWAYDVRADRADTIVPAAVIVSRIAEAARASWVHVPSCGLRDGVLESLARSPRARQSSPRLAAAV